MFYTYLDIINRSYYQIVSENRKVNPDHDTHLSVDCTDTPVQQKGRQFASHKFAKKSGLRYEVAVGIMSGEIKWINGGFPCGQFNDLTIYRALLATMLDPQERYEADDGYAADGPYRAKVPSVIFNFNPEEARAYQKQKWVQGRHEAFNTGLKTCPLFTAGTMVLSWIYLLGCCYTYTALYQKWRLFV